MHVEAVGVVGVEAGHRALDVQGVAAPNLREVDFARHVLSLFLVGVGSDGTSSVPGHLSRSLAYES